MSNYQIPGLYPELPASMLDKIDAISGNGTSLASLLSQKPLPPIMIRRVTPRHVGGRKQYELPEHGITVYQWARKSQFIGRLTQEFGKALAVMPLYASDPDAFLGECSETLRRETGFNGEITQIRSRDFYFEPNAGDADFLMSYDFPEAMAYTTEESQVRPMIESMIQLSNKQMEKLKSSAGKAVLDDIPESLEDIVVDIRPIDRNQKSQYFFPESGITLYVLEPINAKYRFGPFKRAGYRRIADAIVHVNPEDLHVYLKEFMEYISSAFGYIPHMVARSVREYLPAGANSMVYHHRLFEGAPVSDSAHAVMFITYGKNRIADIVEAAKTFSTLVNKYFMLKEAAYQDKDALLAQLMSLPEYAESKAMRKPDPNLQLASANDVLNSFKRSIAESAVRHLR